MTENSKIDDLKEMLLNAEKKLGIERSDENFEKSRTEGFRIFKKILKEDPNYCEEVVSIFENYGEQKRKLIWRYVAHLSIQINEIDPKNKPASGMLEEVVQFLDKMEKDEWKKYWDLVLSITKNVVSRDPKNESAKNLIIEAERIAKDEEEKMEVSVSENAKRLEKVEFEGLTEEGQMAWVVLKKMHGLYKKDSYWLCQANSDQEIHDKLFDALEKFIVSPNALSPDDVNVICERFVRTINLCRRKLGISPYELPDKLKESDMSPENQVRLSNEAGQKNQGRIHRESHLKVRELFWRTYQILMAAKDPHQYKDVWDAIFDEWFETVEDELLPKKYDIDRIIEVIDSRKDKGKNARMKWYYNVGNEEGSFKLVSLSALLSKSKNNPPKN